MNTSIEPSFIYRSGDAIYPFSYNLRDYFRQEDYRITPDGQNLIVHGINKKIATEEAFINGINEFHFVGNNNEIEKINL